ncbi:MAG: nitrous oxide-stimulated promoter family protein [Chitinispirillaceae bacterium]
MIRLYCHGKHRRRTIPCPDCCLLLDYAYEKLRRCRYGSCKPACRRCKTHCYAPDKRETIRAVMRYSGPRMILYHPILAVIHLAKSLRN